MLFTSDELKALVYNGNNKRSIMKDKEKVEKIINDYSPELAAKEILRLFSVSNSALIDYIEFHAEIAMPIDEMFNKDGTTITKKKYGKVLLKCLVKELRAHYC